jgi:hypothetical protein
MLAMIALDLAKRRGEALFPPAMAEINLVAHSRENVLFAKADTNH